MDMRTAIASVLVRLMAVSNRERDFVGGFVGDTSVCHYGIPITPTPVRGVPRGDSSHAFNPSNPAWDTSPCGRGASTLHRAAAVGTAMTRMTPERPDPALHSDGLSPDSLKGKRPP